MSHRCSALIFLCPLHADLPVHVCSLMIGYVFLAKNALEPLSCVETLDGTRWIKAGAAADIRCSWCQTEGDKTRWLSYRQLATLATVFYTIYGLGTPLLFSIILTSNRNRLHTNKFNSSFGFLSSKMREETYWWEVLISFRKLLLVSFVMWSNGQELAFTLINLFVAVGAFGAQAWVRPFANVDANLAEAVTLLCTILMLILGLGAGTETGGDSQGVKGNAAMYLNYSIYAVSGVCVAIATVVLFKRLVGALHSCTKGHKITEMEEHYRELGGTVPDTVREMLHKRKHNLAVAWVALKSKDSKSGELIKSAVDPLISTSPLTHQERMKKVFESARKYQQATELTRLTEWEGYFPKKLRPAMYAWSMQDDLMSQAEAEELNWFIDEMKLFEKEQHSVLPKFVQQCIKAANDEDEDEYDDNDSDTDSGDEDSSRVTFDAGDRLASPPTGFEQDIEVMRRRMAMMSQSASPLTSESNPTSSLTLAAARGTVTAPNRSIRLRHSAAIASSSQQGPPENLRQTWAAPQMLMPTEQELEKFTKRCRRRVDRAPRRLVHALLDFGNGCKYFFFGNIPRTTVAFVFLMTCWGFTVYCIAQFAADRFEAEESAVDATNGSGMCGDPEYARNHSKVWLCYALIFYANVLVMSPLMALLYNTGRRPLFLAVKEPEPAHGMSFDEFARTLDAGELKNMQPLETVGSKQLIYLGKAVVARETLRAAGHAGVGADRNGNGHLTTEERNLVGLSRRKAERLVQFVCMTSEVEGTTLRLNDEELAETLATIQRHEWLMAFTFVLTTFLLCMDAVDIPDAEDHVAHGRAGMFVWSPGSAGITNYGVDWRKGPCIVALACWYLLILVVLPIAMKAARFCEHKGWCCCGRNKSARRARGGSTELGTISSTAQDHGADGESDDTRASQILSMN